MKSIIDEELALLARVSKYAAPKPELAANQTNEQLLDLRDQIAESRLEDHAALINQMLNLSAVAQSRSKPTAASLDLNSPYFGHLELQEQGKKRDVLIGKTTVVDRELGLSIVDWRHAPVSRLYYCYHEGDDYEEDFAGKKGVFLFSCLRVIG